MFELHSPHTGGTYLEEKPDIGLTKAVDGLHRIADHKHGTPVVRRPAAHQFFQQRHLARTGILEFIDQQVLNAVIQRLRQIGGRLLIPQRQTGAAGDFDEIDLTGGLKNQPQLPGRQPQQAGKSLHRRPLCIAELRRRQFAYGSQRRRQPRHVGQGRQLRLHRCLFCGILLIRRKANVFVELFAPVAVAGQQQIGQLLPDRQIAHRVRQHQLPIK